ncbi:glutathione S-transferase family protein [Mesorhizobium sp. UC22_110]|uniref:glutathione S-transferase family protein n=1 Tax=unclassified Mesorhizobium TaxID=325217 RepID=UPI0036722AB9
MNHRPTLYGADYSVYVRIARLALLEKHVDHELVPVDIFAAGGPPGWYRALHPFSRIPAFEHDGLKLFETTAIARYVDEAFEGPALQPGQPRERAVMNQIVGMLDAYAYRTLVWDIYVETVSKPRDGNAVDETVVSAALPRAETCLATLAGLKLPGPWLLGGQLTLADLHAAPMFGYFMQAEMSAAMLARYPALSDWWQSMQARASFLATRPTG